MTNINKLISYSYTNKEASKMENFSVDDKVINNIVTASKQILTVFPDMPLSCLPMSTLLTAMVRDTYNYPIHAVTGSLIIDNTRVFDNNLTKEETKIALTKSNTNWGGHCWVICNNLIIDISLCRTAYSQSSNSRLNQKVISLFGQNRGMFINTYKELKNSGIVYEEDYILNNDEITSFVKGAYSFIEK
mgnify:CR=1 FL=1